MTLGFRAHRTIGTATSVPGHRIRWYAQPGRVPRTEGMRDTYFPGWDAACSCGWETRTGGAIANRIRDDIAEHKWDVTHAYDPATQSFIDLVPPRPRGRRRRARRA